MDNHTTQTFLILTALTLMFTVLVALLAKILSSTIAIAMLALIAFIGICVAK